MTDLEIIFHLAAVKNIEISEFNPIETIDTNVQGMINLLKMLKAKVRFAALVRRFQT